MADTYTTNLNLTKPEPGAAEDTWGISLNADLDALDAIFSTSGTQINLNPNQINFADGKKAVFNSNLNIFSTGTSSYIEEVGTGDLYLKASNLYITDRENNQFMSMIDNGTGGTLSLKHLGSTVLTTTSSGIDVTGTVKGDGLIINGGATSPTHLINGSRAGTLVSIDNESTSTSNGLLLNTASTNANSNILQVTSNDLNRFKVSGNGDISFYDDTGSTQGLFWDASAESLCLGNTSAGAKFDIRQDSGYAIRAENNLGSYFRVAAGGNTEIGGSLNVSNAGTIINSGVNSGTALTVKGESGNGLKTRYIFESGTNQYNWQLGFSTHASQTFSITPSTAANGTTFSNPVLNINQSGAATFTGNVTLSSTAPLLYLANTTSGTGKTWRFSSASNGKLYITQEGVIDAVTLDHTTGNATFAGTITGDGLTVAGSNANLILGTTGNDITFTRNADNYISATGGTSSNIIINPQNRFVVNTGGSERLRVDTSGNLLVGTTSTNPQDGDHGFVARANGYTLISVDNARAMLVNRTSSDGDIISLAKAGTIVGSIGVEGGNNLFIGSTALNHSGLNFTANAISPMLQGSLTDATIALGTPSRRFTNLHLSGTAFVDAINADGSTVYYSGTKLRTGSTSESQAGVSINTSTTGTGYLLFGDGTGASAYVGQIAYAHSDNSMQFRTAGAEKLRIDSSGRLGLGTTSPAEKLDIVSNASVNMRLNNTGQNISLQIGAQASAARITAGSGDRLGLGAGNTQDILNIASGGNIGINTTSPSSALEVNNVSAGATVATFEGNYSGSGDVKLASFERVGGAVAAAMEYNDATTDMEFGTTTSHNFSLKTADTRRLTISSGGNVGIGTASPSHKLDIAAGDIGLDSGRTLYLGSDSNVSINSTSSSRVMRFYTGGSERARIDSSGRLGIKNSNPTATLTVGTLSSGQTGNVVINNEGGNTATLEVLSRTNRSILKVADNDTTGYISAENGLFSIGRNSGNNSANINIDSSNRVGIGTNSPSHLLSVGTEGNSSGKKISLYLGGTNGNYSAIGAQRAEDNTYCQSEIRFINENNSSGLGAFAIATGNNNLTERMRIDSSGRLGLGDTAPQDYLEINGSGKGLGGLTISNSTHNHAALSFARSSTATARIYLNEPDATHTGQLNFQTSNASGGSPNLVTAMVIDENQRVGIGTTSPSENLSIVGSANTGMNIQAGTSHIAFLDFGDSGDTNFGGINYNNADDTLNLRAGNSNRLTINSSGKVGIGTASPSVPLSVVGDIQTSTKLITKTTNGEVLRFERASDSLRYNSITSNSLDSGEAFISFKVHDGVSATSQADVLHLKGNGKVGIGTTSPASPLDVISNSSAQGIRVRGRSSDDIGQIDLANNGGTVRSQLQWDNTFLNIKALAAIPMIFYTNATERMRIQSDGSVGIGTTSPGEKLHVVGNAEISGNIETSTFLSTGNATVEGTFTSEGLFTTENKAQIEGIKSGSTNPIATIKNRHTTNTNGTYLDFVDHNDNFVCSIGTRPQDNTSNSFIIGGSGSYKTGLKFLNYTTYQAIYPATADGATTDNTIDLGYSSGRFQDIYATNGTIQTSDKNEKQDIQALTEAEQRVATACKGLIRRFRWQDAVEKKDNNPDSDLTARYHFGVMAQDLQDAFEAEGLDAGDYGMFISSTWTDDEGNEQTRLGVRYNELLAFIITTL